MPSETAATEPLAVQVMRAVLSSRLPAAPDQRQTIEDALAVHDSVCVRVAIGHSECEARCTRSAPVELWSVRVEEEEEEGRRGQGPRPLPSLFLLNAVRSYVHFSQLSAWLRPAADDGAEPPAAASYELLLPQQHQALAARALLAPPADATLAEHAFPLAADTRRGRVVRVTVAYVQRSRPLQPSGLCLQLGRLPTDEWLLPSPLPSPTGHEESLLMMASSPTALFEAAEITRGAPKHKASEPPLFSPNGPALKQAFLGGEKEEELVIEHVRDECTREDTVVEEEQICLELLEEKEEKRVEEKKEEEERERKTRRRTMMMMREKEKEQPAVKRERRGGLRRMIGGWEESVLKGAMEERPLPHAGYTLTIVPASSAPVRLRLTTAALVDVTTTCVARATVAECERVRESVGAGRKMIRRRGLQVQSRGQMQMSLLNGEGTLLRSLTMPYDVSEMPDGATTVVRQRVRLVPKTEGLTQSPPTPLRYLIQMSLTRDRSGRCFVTGEITVVFSTDASFDGANVVMDPVTGVARSADLFELQAETVTAPFSLKSPLLVV